FIEDFFVKEGTMPGFSEGMGNVSRDEQRHIGFGVKALSEMFAESDECKQAVVELLREVFPFLPGVFVPPGWDERYTTEYGFTLEDIYAFGMRSVEAKWRAAGFPLEEMPPDLYPFDPSLPHEERARNQIVLLKAGVIGEPNGRPDSSPETQRVLFEIISRSANTGATNGRPWVFQWRFSDADPWHIVVENGSTRVEPGDAPHPDMTIESSWQQWIEVSTRGQNPLRAIVSRRLRPRGSLRGIRAFMGAFAPRRV
ncbi:MAG TPA: SCP2 sterol-binding domain-containing protein, partial [Solirubrobacterales bacterium]